MSKLIEDRKEQGFTLIELLIAIVVVGILAAVAIVGIAGLTNTGSKSACTATEDAAHAASAAFYANNNNTWPTSFKEMTTDTATNPVNSPPVMELQSGVTLGANDQTLTNGSWKLVGAFSTTATPDFAGAGLGCQ